MVGVFYNHRHDKTSRLKGEQTMTKAELIKESSKMAKKATEYLRKANKCKTYEGWKRNFDKMKEYNQKSFEYMEVYMAL